MSSAGSVTGIILAGGRSLRYGRDKAFEEFGGETLIDRALRTIRSLPEVGEILIATSERLSSRMGYLTAPNPGARSAGAGTTPTRLVFDLTPGQGPMGGIYAGLSGATFEYSLVVGCDMPFLNAGLLQYMIGLSPGYDMVVPRTSGLPEPLHAVYSKGCVPAIKSRLEEGKPMVYRLLEGVRARYVEQDEVERFDPGHLSFFNINSLADMEKARAILTSEAKGDAFSRQV